MILVNKVKRFELVRVIWKRIVNLRFYNPIIGFVFQ